MLCIDNHPCSFIILHYEFRFRTEHDDVHAQAWVYRRARQNSGLASGPPYPAAFVLSIRTR